MTELYKGQGMGEIAEKNTINFCVWLYPNKAYWSIRDIWLKYVVIQNYFNALYITKEKCSKKLLNV